MAGLVVYVHVQFSVGTRARTHNAMIASAALIPYLGCVCKIIVLKLLWDTNLVASCLCACASLIQRLLWPQHTVYRIPDANRFNSEWSACVCGECWMGTMMMYGKCVRVATHSESIEKRKSQLKRNGIWDRHACVCVCVRVDCASMYVEINNDACLGFCLRGFL